LPNVVVPSNERALVVLERTRDDLGGRRAAAVDEDDHREVGIRPGLVREVLLLLVLETAVRVDDEARVEEHVRHLHGLREEAAGVVPEVEDDALDAARLLVELLDRALEVVVGPLLELRHAQVAVALLQHLRLDALDLDDLAGEARVEELLRVVAFDGELDLRVGLAAHSLHGLDEGHVLRELAVDLQDDVARLDAGAVGGGVFDRRDDREHAALVRDLDAEAAEAALRLDL
jgi:hypothetical protein